MNEAQILKALQVVMDPDLGRNIVDLGFIKNLSVEGGKVRFDLELTTPACPVKEDLQRQCHEAVSKIEGVREVEVRLKAQSPLSKAAERAQASLRQVANIVAVSSCKGGVGKSTVAANLAVGLARSGARVGLLDADIFGPSQPTMLGVADKQPWVEAEQFVPFECYGVKMMSAWYLFPPGEAAVLRGPMVSNVLQQVLLATRWGALDYLIIDMPPGTGDVQLTICQVLPLSGALIVTTPQKISLIDVHKGIAMLSKVNVPILGIVENMSSFKCGSCGADHELFGPSGTQHLCSLFGIDLLGRLPFVPSVVAGGDRGHPAVLDEVEGGPRPYSELSEKVVREVAKAAHHKAKIPAVDIKW